LSTAKLYRRILELIKASIEFAERGGKILVDIRNSPDIGQASKGTHDDVAADDIGADDPVTNGDKVRQPLTSAHS